MPPGWHRPRGGVRNALQHMWGYVSQHSLVHPQFSEPVVLLREIQRWRPEHKVSYC